MILCIQRTLINLYAELDIPKLHVKVFVKMPKRDVALLSPYVEKGMTETAQDLFDEMEAKNVDSWNFMMSVYAKAGLVEEARRVFDIMSSKNGA